MKWSYSGLKKYLTCPWQYYQTKVLNAFVEKDTKHTIYGKKVHKILEDYFITLTKPRFGVPPELKKVMAMIDVLRSAGASLVLAEYKMALDIAGNPCDFESPDYWVRGIADAILTHGTLAVVLDWKTGNPKYADTKQLELMAIMLFKHCPHIDEIDAGLYFIPTDKYIKAGPFFRHNYEELWAHFAPDVMQMHVSFENNNWPMKPSGLCGWCPVTSCPHHRDR